MLTHSNQETLYYSSRETLAFKRLALKALPQETVALMEHQQSTHAAHANTDTAPDTKYMSMLH